MIGKNNRQCLKLLCNTLHASNTKKRSVVDFMYGAQDTNAPAPELWPILNRCEKLQKTKVGKYIFTSELPQ